MQDTTIQIPPWYKLTEIGVIPQDWEVKCLWDLAKIQRGASPRPIDNPIWFDRVSPIWWVRISDVTKSNKYLYETTQKLSEQGVRRSRYVEKNNLIMSICATVGRPVITKLNVCIHDWFVVFAWLTENKEYLYYYLSFIESQWWKNGQTWSQMNLNTNIIQIQHVPLPTVIEQQSIATALTDIDKLISELDTLIIKKQAIKQWTMQQLFTGKKRLPGFGWEREIKAIEQMAYCLDNLRVPLNDPQRKKMQWDIPYCGANWILDYVNDYVIDDDIILMAEDWGYFDEYKYRPIAYRMKWKCWINNHAHILKANEKTNQDYLFFSLVNKNILNYINWWTRAKLNKWELYKIEISIPKDIEEQQAIAQFLSDMDNDIQNIITQRDKYISLKQGMMQQLLTGKIRLV